jgi:hypothetical protein
VAEALRHGQEMILPLGRLDDADQIRFTAIAAPVFDPIGQVLLSMSIAGPPHPVRAGRVRELGRRLAEEAAIATRQTKGQMPDPNGRREVASVADERWARCHGHVESARDPGEL